MYRIQLRLFERYIYININLKFFFIDILKLNSFYYVY